MREETDEEENSQREQKGFADKEFQQLVILNSTPFSHSLIVAYKVLWLLPSAQHGKHV